MSKFSPIREAANDAVTIKGGQCPAMWLFGAEYARQRLGAVDFYANLGAARWRLVDDFLAELDHAAAPPAQDET